MRSLFSKPGDPAGITFMIRGEPGSGKTRFALGAKRITKLPVAYIGTDRGAKFYKDDPEVGGFLQVETRDAKTIDNAIAELAQDDGDSFGAVAVDTVTDMWTAEQKEFEKEKKGKDGKPVKYIPINSWRPMREGHENKLRKLQALPLHVFLICEEKPIYEKIGGGADGEGAELREVGSKEDADKKDSYVCDVRLRFFVDRSNPEQAVFCAEVLKDRTGTFTMGEIVDNPRVEMWVKGRATKQPKPAPPVENGEVAQGAGKSVNGAAAVKGEITTEKSPDDDPKFIADEMIERVGKIKNQFEARNWKKKHKAEIDALWNLDTAQHGRVIASMKAKAEELGIGEGAAAGGST
jgi:hypothetical protein